MADRIVEIQGWGWNWLTVSFIATIVLDIAEAGVMLVQMHTIRRTGKADSVSVMWFCYFGCLLIALGCYGIRDQTGRISLAMIGEGILGMLFYVPMMVILKKVRGYTPLDKKILVGSLAMIPAILLLPSKDLLATLFMGGAIFASATLPWEIWKNKSRGQVELGLIFVYIINISMWMLYGFKAGILPLMIATPIGTGILLVTLALWLTYPVKTKLSTA